MKLFFKLFFALLLFQGALDVKAQQVSVISWNMWVFGRNAVNATGSNRSPQAQTERNNRIKAIGDFFQSNKPDILLAQEVLHGEAKNFILQNLNHGSPQFQGVCSPSRGNQRQGNCVFWRKNLVKLSGESRLPPHISLSGFKHPPMLVKLTHKSGKRLCVASVHIILGQRVNQRDAEIEGLLRELNSKRCYTFIVGGDFNRNKRQVYTIVNKVGDTGNVPNFITGARVHLDNKTTRRKTDPGSAPINPYDHFIVSKDISERGKVIKENLLSRVLRRIERARVCTKPISDHYPIKMRISLPSAPINNGTRGSEPDSDDEPAKTRYK